jgi:hypothetical protein
VGTRIGRVDDLGNQLAQIDNDIIDEPARGFVGLAIKVRLLAARHDLDPDESVGRPLRATLAVDDIATLAAIRAISDRKGRPGRGSWAHEIDEERIADLMATPFAARSNVWTCRPIARYVCGADRCDSASALVSVKLDFAAGMYVRCDAKGCDTYVIDLVAGKKLNFSWLYTTVSTHVLP